jgi:hypothetical protein
VLEDFISHVLLAPLCAPVGGSVVQVLPGLQRLLVVVQQLEQLLGFALTDQHFLGLIHQQRLVGGIPAERIKSNQIKSNQIKSDHT